MVDRWSIMLSYLDSRRDLNKPQSRRPARDSAACARMRSSTAAADAVSRVGPLAGTR